MGKVTFLQVCVCPRGGRVSASVHAGIPDPPQDQAGRHPLPRNQAGSPPRPVRHPPDQADTPRDQADTPHDQADPPGSRLQHTVYERPVRILLESILVDFVCWRLLPIGFSLCVFFLQWIVANKMFIFRTRKPTKLATKFNAADSSKLHAKTSWSLCFVKVEKPDTEVGLNLLG